MGFPKIPLVSAGDSRLLPQFFEGAMLSVREFDKVDIDLGQMRAVNYREFSGSRKMQTGNYLSVESDRFNYLGGTWRIAPNASVGVWEGELKDVYRQTLYTTTLNQPLGAWKLGAVVNYLASSEAGEELAGKLDSRMASTLLSANLGPQTFRLGLQYNAGDSALPFLHDTDLPGVANAVQVLRFDRAQERSWQARYDFDFAGVGLPGLVAMARYVHGDNFKVAGQDGQEWERDIDVSYTIQSGTFKDLSFRLRNVELVGDATGRRDENRFIVSYPLSLL